ncbi:sensor histidine kinase [Lysobacter enzymogenes]|uniref:histidine kinase n=1 Tax=Lysobacter enzymogenes TaxID=69 RepID=A0AAU9AQ14_LYSEN|nr:HAMP domain-containing sensor histidine kinase [Lysobacter enzymogenes]BAV97550.1 integral membrane sensor signal transduction histidine kinase [Lysobacter enzymogenes]
MSAADADPGDAAPRRARGWLPRSMASRLYLILFAGLALAHTLSFSLLFYERYVTATSMMLGNLELDVRTTVAMLDRLPADERAQWLPQFKRRTYHYLLSAGEPGTPQLSERAQDISQMVGGVLGSRYPIRTETVERRPERFQIHLTLSDGRPLTIEVMPSTMPIAQWLPYVLAAQLALLVLCAWLAVRLATRPLEQLAQAAQALSPASGGKRLGETGPTEVAQAAAAFNAMQDRIAAYLRERLQILASISHDLQTPITRMRLRTEAMDESPERTRLLDDLEQIQHLVREGVDYARSAHGTAEPAIRLDLDAFLDSVVCDYQDTGKAVTLSGRAGAPLVARAHALRRVACNLIDNAVKYAGAAEVEVARCDDGGFRIDVLDRGPGIPAEELDAVMQPFYRLEASRNRDTGGTGLGLAIAQQLASSLGGRLSLSQREGGGLRASLWLPAQGRD